MYCQNMLCTYCERWDKTREASTIDVWNIFNRWFQTALDTDSWDAYDMWWTFHLHLIFDNQLAQRISLHIHKKNLKNLCSKTRKTGKPQLFPHGFNGPVRLLDQHPPPLRSSPIANGSSQDVQMDLLQHGMPTRVSGAHPCLDMTCSLAQSKTVS